MNLKLCHSEYCNKVLHYPLLYHLGCESSVCPAYQVIYAPCSVVSSHPSCQIHLCGTAMIVRLTLLLLNNGPVPKSKDAGNLNMPKSSHKVLPLREKVKSVCLFSKQRKSYGEVAKICAKDTSFCEIVKKERNLF